MSSDIIWIHNKYDKDLSDGDDKYPFWNESFVNLYDSVWLHSIYQQVESYKLHNDHKNWFVSKVSNGGGSPNPPHHVYYFFLN